LILKSNQGNIDITMGGVPKWNKTRGKVNQRRMHIFIKKSALASCPKCGKPVLPHTVCFNCGYYKGMEVIDVFKKLNKKEKKQREKELAAKEKEGKTAGNKPLSMEELSRR